MTQKITLVGGGLAGSLLSIYLAKRGFDVHVYEKRGDVRVGQADAGRSINLALSTRGIKALNKIGLDEAVLAEAIPMTGRMMHSVEGNLAYQPYGKEGQAIYSVSRSGLNKHLLTLAGNHPNITLYFRHKCTYADLENGVTRYEAADGTEIEDAADVVIGTDGAYSAIRDAFQKAGRFNYSQVYESHGYKELEITPDDQGAFRLNKNCLHIWPRKSFMMIALPNPDASFTCTLFLPYQGQPGFDDLTSEASVMQFYKQQFGDAVPMMPGLVKDFFDNPTGSLVTIKSFPWFKGKTALLGDSAHAIVPFYGQGMNCSFEDCLAFDNAIEACGTDWQKVFEHYQQARKINADAIADLAVQNFIEMRDLVGQPTFLHRKSLEHDLSELYPAVYKSQYERVTFSTEPYSHALQQGASNNALLDFLIQNQMESRVTDKLFMESKFKEFGLAQ